MLSAMFLQNVLVAHKAVPVVRLFDLLHVCVGEISANAFVAEDEWTCRAAENFTALSTPSAVIF
jgi:hypothetical protein